LEDPTQAVSYLGVLQQALRDLSAWVEKGIAPPASTNYKIEDGQVVILPSADERKGIQPVVNATVNGSKRADINSGKTVILKAVIEVPKNTGKIVSAAWDFDGSGTYKDVVNLAGAKVDNNGSHVEISMKHSFTEPGTYFPVLRVASEGKGDMKTPFARIQNLDKVRVVVK
jgi:hypothetical protein